MNKLRRMITSREGLFDWLADQDFVLKYGTLQRALHTGLIKNLGWHCQIAGSEYPGWVIQMTTKFGKIVYVAIISDTDKYENRCYELTSLAGCVYQGGKSELYRGDKNG